MESLHLYIVLDRRMISVFSLASHVFEDDRGSLHMCCPVGKIHTSRMDRSVQEVDIALGEWDDFSKALFQS